MRLWRNRLYDNKTGESFEYIGLSDEDRAIFQSMCEEFDGTAEEFFRWAHAYVGRLLLKAPGAPKKPRTLRAAFLEAKAKNPKLGERAFVIRHFKLDPSDEVAVEKYRGQLRRQKGVGR